MDLKQCCKLTTSALSRACANVATSKGAESWLIAPDGVDDRICVVAHIDTVHKQPCKDIFRDAQKGVLWSPQGIGGDDRAGIYASLRIYAEIPKSHRPVLLFTDGEEVGGTGAMEACCLYPELENVAFFLGLDRRGSGEFVTYGHESGDFIKFMESFGLRQSWGSFSDVSILAPYFGKVCANLAVGFHNAHSLAEYIVESEVEQAIRTAKKIILNHDTNQNNFTPDPIWWEWGTKKGGIDVQKIRQYYNSWGGY